MKKRHIHRSIAFLAAAAMFLTGCSSKPPAEHNTSTSTLEVSVEHAYSAEQIPLEHGADQIVPVGENFLVSSYGENGRMCYALYTPRDGSMTPVTLDYYETLAETAAEDQDGGINSLFSDDEGNVTVIYETFTLRDGTMEDFRYYMETYDSGMHLTASGEITDKMYPDKGNHNFAAGGDGRYYNILRDDGQGTCSVGVFDADFRPLGSIGGEMQDVLSSVTAQDGTVWLCCFDADYRTGFARVNGKDKTIESLEITDIPENITGCLTGSGDYDIYCFDNNGLYGIKAAEGICEEVVNWFNSDFMGKYIVDCAAAEDGRFLITIYDMDYTNCELWMLTKRSEEELENLQLISLAAMVPAVNLQKAVTEYNRSSRSHRIVIYDYGTDLEQFKTDMTSGIAADIICMEGIPYTSFISKGIFEDLTPFLEADEDFREDTYFMNYFDSLKYGDKLYRLGVSCSVQTLAAKTEFAGEDSGISFAEMMALSENLPEGMELFPAMTREDALDLFCISSMKHFVDVENASCDFDSAAFTELLACCSTFPPAGEAVYEDLSLAYRNDEALFCAANFLEPFQYHELLAGQFGTEAVTLTGYPTTDGEGNGGIFYSEFTLAMCAESAYQQEIWAFFKYMLGEEFQKELQWYLPVNRAALQYKMEEAASDLLKQTGNGETITVPRYYFIGDGEIDIGNATQQEMDDLTAYMNGITTFYYLEDSIEQIITEESSMYFAGDQTAEEAVERIQSRVSIYLSEQQ